MSNNVIKVGTANDSLSIQQGPFAVGAAGVGDYGPTSRTGYYAAIDVPAGARVFYQKDIYGNLSAQVAHDDAQALYFLKSYGATGTTLADALAWSNSQPDLANFTADISSSTVIAANSSSTPTPTPQPTSTPTPTPTPSSYTIGQAALGGIIAYITGGGSTGTSGLVVTSTDVSTGTDWGCFGTSISGAYGTAIGTGDANTIAIMAGCPTTGIAARLCGDLVSGGFSDWYLPSKDELNALYINRVAIGGLGTNGYWSSTETPVKGNTGFATYQDFSTGASTASNKTNNFYVRAIRSF
jgi:hypothetical protein